MAAKMFLQLSSRKEKQRTLYDCDADVASNKYRLKRPRTAAGITWIRFCPQVACT